MLSFRELMQMEPSWILWDPSHTLRMTKHIHFSWCGWHVIILRALAGWS